MKRIKDLNIFVVDDNPLAQKVYQQYLQRLGCVSLRVFDNGDDCLKQLEPEPPDLVLVDYLMAPLNGLELILRLKLAAPNAYLVMISGQTDLQVAVNAMKNGAFDYIIKGATEAEQIATVLQRVLGNMNLVRRGRPRSVYGPKVYPSAIR